MTARAMRGWAAAAALAAWLGAPAAAAAASEAPCAWPGSDAKKLYAFLEQRCYADWTKDSAIRDTGPFIAPETSYGVHPASRIHYSEEVWAWVEAGRPKGGLGAHGTIVKEMYTPPAKRYAGLGYEQAWDKLCAWTVMVRDTSVADGWYWSYHAKPDAPAALCGAAAGPARGDAFERRVRAQLAYPDSGLGLYCLRCHASAEDAQTFSTTANVSGEPLSYLVVPPKAGPAQPEPGTFAAGFHAAVGGREQPPGPALAEPLAKASEAFLRRFDQMDPVTRKQAEAETAMPPETFDHVVMPAEAEVDPEVQFVTSDQCIGCHDAAEGMAWNPPMLIEDQATGRIVNLSPYGEWRASMMGLAGRDPIFYAQLASEVEQHPAHAGSTQNTCLHCHGVMGQRQYARDTGTQAFTRAMAAVYTTDLDGNTEAPYKYGALARDGISCAVCHHIETDKLGTKASFTGNFELAPPGTIYGPYQDVLDKPMEHALDMTPKQGEAIASSALCGSCHTVIVQVLDGDEPVKDPQTGEDMHDLEQATYLEWVNSAFQDEYPPVDYAAARSCRGCHMPRDYRDFPLAFRIAAIQSADYPDTHFLLPHEELALERRRPYSRHMLNGINLFGLEMFQQFPLLLGIRVTDPMAPGVVQKGLITAERAGTELAREKSARVAFTRIATGPESLEATVQVSNLAGHKLPSGVGFRRAFLEFRVLDAAGATLWASGTTNELGIILGPGGEPLKTEFFTPDQQAWQPHRERITRQDQVQIYEELTRDPEGRLTTSFLALYEQVKDNRLVPQGWVQNASKPEILEEFADEMLACAWNANAEECAALEEAGYADGGGYDRLTYAVACEAGLAEAARVTATLYYQATPPYYLADRFTHKTPDGGSAKDAERSPDSKRLYYLASHLNTQGTPIEDWKLEIASAARNLPAGVVCPPAQ